MVNLAEVEGDARALIQMAGLDPSEPHSIRALCIGLTGYPPLVVPMFGSQGQLSSINRVIRVAVSSRLSPTRQRWVCGHELGHFYYQRIGYVGANLEAMCDLLGAILCAPRCVVQAAFRVHGNNPRAIAKYVGVTESVALLRLGEIGVVSGTALATPSRTVARGEIVWPDTDTLRRFVRTGEVPHGKRVRITDEPSRGGLLVFDEE